MLHSREEQKGGIMAPVPGTNTDETLHLTITVPKDVAQHVRDEIAKGIYASESDYVESILLSETLFEPIDQDELTHWMNTEGARRLEALHRDPSSGLTSDQAFAGLLDDEGEG
jgi:Arc/MetJ-type ribon-helix-helix transcriptional regulator